MKIKIDIKNNTAINTALDKVNGKANSFTISSGSEVVKISEAAEKRLAMLPKAERKGAKAMFRPSGPNARSYGYNAKSTRVYMERGASGWFLTNIQPDSVSPKQPEMMHIEITPEQSAEIQRRAIANFHVKPAAI
jgi:hypothetical protein